MTTNEEHISMFELDLYFATQAPDARIEEHVTTCSSCGGYLAELADRSLEERHGAAAVYHLLRRAYELLDAGMAPGRVARWYEMHLADELGVRPETDRCVECDRLLEPGERFRWIPPLGGVVCERCPGPPHERAGLSLAQGLETVGKETSEPLAAEIRRVVREYKHGRPLAEALRAAKDRLNIDSFTLFASAVLVSLERGGRITDALERIITRKLHRALTPPEPVKGPTAKEDRCG